MAPSLAVNSNEDDGKIVAPVILEHLQKSVLSIQSSLDGAFKVNSSFNFNGNGNGNGNGNVNGNVNDNVNGNVHLAKRDCQPVFSRACR
jgi:hypothetical protein